MEKHSQLLKKFDLLTHLWLHELDNYTEEELSLKPGPEEWCLGQVYNHLLYINRNYFQVRMEDCLTKNYFSWSSPNTLGKIILLCNTLPPQKYKMPAHLLHFPELLDSKAECKANFLATLADIQSITERLNDAHPYQRSRHPFYGMLNAFEWFKFMNIHMHHHFRQKKRLDHFLRTQTNVIFKDERSYRALQKI